MTKAQSSFAITPAWVIQKKRDGEELSPQEITAFIQGVTSGEIADYQASAFLMAVFFRGMTSTETTALTQAMVQSGATYDLGKIPGFKVDKHSTGGVGDKVSIILAPLAAACGLTVPMMAGRGLGHTGGTVDKMEAIPGYKTLLSPDEFRKVLKEVGCAIVGQSPQIAPADRKLYALRDVTATVECIPLIVASILSKKIAEGTQGLVMDIKIGNGAFMKTKAEARALAKGLIDVSAKFGVKTRAVLTSMDQPLGCTAGNTLEILECLEILNPSGPQLLPCSPGCASTDLKELTIHLTAMMLLAAKKAPSLPAARKIVQARLQDGSAYQRFLQMVEAQGGDLRAIHHPERLPIAPHQLVWNSPKSGWLNHMGTQGIGRLLVDLGGGRKKTSDPIDAGVGFVFHKKLGARVRAGEPLVTVFCSDPKKARSLEEQFQRELLISAQRKPVPKLIEEMFGK
jgi:pyrimidine-nucleoside phosphorylase